MKKDLVRIASRSKNGDKPWEKLQIYLAGTLEMNDASKRSRLWSMKDIDHVLAKDKENKAIESIVLNSFESYEGHWNLEAFSKLCNLKLLILRASLHLCNGLNCLSDALRVLEWEGYPLESLPPSIQLNKLVDLKLHHSKVKQLWSGIKNFQKLKFIDLSYSEYLTQTPNVSRVPCLETMVLKGCINLLEIHQSIGQHKKLAMLNLEGCLNLKILPKKLEMNSLQNFILSGCSKVKKLPEFGDDMESLSVLVLEDCKNLLCLPNSMHNLKSLKILNISGCSKFSRLPNNWNENDVLEELDASGTAIREVPSCIINLKNLQKLSFRGCKGLPSNSWDLTYPFRWFHNFWRQQNQMGMVLPSISQMPMLRELDLSFCNLGDGSIFDNLGNLSSLRKLNLQGNNFMNLPTHSIVSLSKLHYLNVRYCARLQSLPLLPPSLKFFYTWGCTSMNFVSYAEQLCDLFAPQRPAFKGFGGDYGPLSIPGTEIPTWFDSQSYCSNDFLISAFPEVYGYYDSIVSIIVDIPDHCRSSKFWGIAVCLALEHTSPSYSRGGHILWTCKAPEADFSNESFITHNWCYPVQEFNYPVLFIAFFSDRRVEQIKKHVACDENPFELIFCSRGWEKESKLKIMKCGYRLLWKDNVEMYSNALTKTKRCQPDEVEEDDNGAVEHDDIEYPLMDYEQPT